MTEPEAGPAPTGADPETPAASPAPAEQPAPSAEAPEAQTPAAAPAATPAPAPAAPVAAPGRRPRRRPWRRVSRRGEPRTYDFRRPTKLSREHVRVLQIAQEAFARQATTILTDASCAPARAWS